VVAVVAVAAGGIVVLRPFGSSSAAPGDGYSDPLGPAMPESPAGPIPPVNKTKPATGQLTLGAETSVATKMIGAVGGTIAAQGLQIQVPDGTLAADTNFDVKQAPITGNTFGGFVTPITPLYLIDDGGATFAKPVTVVLQATIPAGATAMAFSYDDASGTLTPLTPIAQDATSLTVAATHFSPVLGGLLDVTDSSAPVDSGHRATIDDWRFKNNGAIIAPAGICEGMNLSSIWYYINQPLGAGVPLHGVGDNNGASPATPNFWQDDSNAYRFAASVQKSPRADWPMYVYLWRFQELGDGRANYEALRAAIKGTGQPQLLTIDTDARDAGHSVIVEEVEANQLLVSDPNYPGPKDNPRYIPYDPATGKLGPYSSGKNSADIAAHGVRIYTRFAYIPRATSMADAVIAAQWAQFQSKTAGDTMFPKYDLEALAGTDEQGQEVWAPLVDGYRTSDSTLRVRLSDPGSPVADNVLMQVFRGTSGEPAVPNGHDVTVNLTSGHNPLGFLEVGRADHHVPWQYVNFLRLDVVRADPITLAFDPATLKDGQTNVGIEFKVTATGIPDTAKRVSFTWIYDGDVVDEDPYVAPFDEEQVSQSNHAFADEGSHEITVILYDTTGSTPAELARATWDVEIIASSPSSSQTASTEAAGTHWVLISTTPNPAPAGKSTASTSDKTWVTDSSDGKVSVTYDHLGVDGGVYHYDASTTWTPPPASAVPGDTWTTILSARSSCKLVTWFEGRPIYPQGGAHISVWVSLGSQGEIYTDTSEPSEATADCSSGSGEDPAVESQDTKLSWAFPDLTYSEDDSTRALDTLRIEVDCAGYGETTWSYLYEWKP
jgi:hypothetical protein